MATTATKIEDVEEETNRRISFSALVLTRCSTLDIRQDFKCLMPTNILTFLLFFLFEYRNRLTMYIDTRQRMSSVCNKGSFLFSHLTVFQESQKTTTPIFTPQLQCALISIRRKDTETDRWRSSNRIESNSLFILIYEYVNRNCSVSFRDETRETLFILWIFIHVIIVFKKLTKISCVRSVYLILFELCWWFVEIESFYIVSLNIVVIIALTKRKPPIGMDIIVHVRCSHLSSLLITEFLRP